jgi:NAD(P)H-dependent FMN reductase
MSVHPRPSAQGRRARVAAAVVSGHRHRADIAALEESRDLTDRVSASAVITLRVITSSAFHCMITPFRTAQQIAVVLGSTRPGRNGEAVARWAYDLAGKRDDAEFELLDIAAFDLPMLDEPVPPSMAQYGHEHTKRWAAKVAEFDGYIFVTPEYNHSTPAALKNALDYLYAEWNNKAAGFVSYGSAGGIRAVEQLRLTMAELQVATVRPRSHCRCSPISRTSAASTRPHSMRPPSPRCSTSSFAGARR